MMTTKAFAYLRTSSATNVGADKDSDKRQRQAIAACAKANKIELAGEYYDADVKGADPVHTRPAFSAMLEAVLGNGVRTIIVESASRFARDLIVQETGFAYLRDLGITLIAADGHDFSEETPTAVLIRQVLGAVAQFEKASLVAKLKGARESARKSDKTWREGRKPAPPEAIRLARRLRRQGLSLQAIGVKLAEQGFTVPATGKDKGKLSSKVYAPQSIKHMLAT
jgi:DNA invertase Pin-like site-specific DNA recombinase